jgi:hypothetical protein
MSDRRSRPPGNLLIIEAVLLEGDTPHHPADGSLKGDGDRAASGRVRRVLAGGGFRLTRVVRTSTHQSVIEAMTV